MKLFALSLNSVGGVTPPIPPDIQSINLDFKSGIGEESTITTSYNGINIISRLLLYDERNYQINFGKWTIDNVDMGGVGDNIPPIYIENKTLSGRHGYIARYYSTNMLSENTDIYSIWQNISNSEQIIYVGKGIYGGAMFTSRNGDSVISDGTYSHISGALNTSNITLTSGTNTLLFPQVKFNYKKVFIDGVEISTTENGIYEGIDSVKFSESFDVVEVQSLKDWYVSNQGCGEQLKTGGGDSYCRIINDYIVDETGFINGKQRFDVIKNNLVFDRIMNLQQVNLLSSGDEWYVPRSALSTVDGVPTDFNYKVPYTDKSDTSVFVADSLKFTNSHPDRMFQISNNLGLTLVNGFLPILNASIINRNNYVTNGGNIAAWEKFYFNAVSKVASSVGGTLSTGTAFEFYSYRGVFPINPNRTSTYFIKNYNTGKGYLFADWHDLPKNDTIAIPLQYQGKPFTVVEKTSNVTISTGTLGSTLSVTIADTLNYGWLTLEIGTANISPSQGTILDVVEQ